jgi:flagellar basal-body rod modification protein FlgD
MTSAVNSTSSSQGASASSSDAIGNALGGNKTLGQDAFMKLLVAQIQHQDPLNPQSNTEFVSQLAQFSSVEQQMGTNKLLELVSVQQKGVANTEDVQLIGKSVTVTGNALTSDGQGYAIPGSFTLSAAATKVTINVKDATGNTVRTIDGGARGAGVAQYSWDGRNDAGTVQPAGRYTVEISAKDAKGNPVPVDQTTTGVVKSVSYDATGPLLTLVDGTQARTSDLSQVSAPPTATK